MELCRFAIFSQFQINNFLTDIQITLINGNIKAHKLVLAASSEFFKALLNSDACKEVSTGIISLPSINYDVFNYIFDYIYLRPPEAELKQELSFYMDVIEASDYLRIMDIIKILDLKISSQFLFAELCKEFDRIVTFPLENTKSLIQNQFIDCINSKDYSSLIEQPPSILLKIIECENFTVDENILWDFFSFYFEKTNLTQETDCKQKLINAIRPGLLDRSQLENFYLFLTNNNYLWNNKTSENLKMLLADFPDETVLKMNFYNPYNDYEIKLINKLRFIPYLITTNTEMNKSVIMSKISLTTLDQESKLILDMNSDNFRYHSSMNHLLFINEDWHLNQNLGVLVNLLNYKHCQISHWHYQTNNSEYIQKFWGFSVVLFKTDLYLFGGCHFTFSNVTVPSNKIVKFSFVEQKWSPVENIMLKVACWSSSACKDIRNSFGFYISGGRSPQKYLKSFYMIDFQTNTLIDYPNLPFNISGHTMEMVNNNFIVIYGGTWDGNIHHDILLFEIYSSLWRVVTTDPCVNTVHIDYCFKNTGNEENNEIIVYDLRSTDQNRCLICVQQIQMNGKSLMFNHISDINVHHNCAKPQNVMFAMSLKMPNETYRISLNDFVNNKN